MGIKRYSAAYRSTNECDEGFYVLHEDHVASHAYDEAKERELFANAMHEMGRCSSVSGVLDDGGLYYFKSEWEIWQACAKSRSRSAE